MKITRRQFVTGSAYALGTAGAAVILNNNFSFSPVTSAVADTSTSYRGAVAILQGFTNQHSTQMTVQFSKSQPVSYRVLNASGVEIGYEINRRETRSYSDYVIEKIGVNNLLLGVNYRFQIIEEKSGKVIDERNFSALDLGKEKARFVVASCMNDNYVSQREVMWDRVAQTKPDFILLPGDTCYSDKRNDGDAAGYWRRYNETRTRLSLFRQKTLIPTMAVWDDHDFGTNNGNTYFGKKNLVKEIFDIFWDSEERLGFKRGPGQSFCLTGFGQRFFMMDGRYFKTSKEENGSQWGNQQEEFLLTELAKSKDPAWILNGTLFFGGYLRWESFEYDHNKNFKNFLKELSTQEAPVAFISGDVHFSEIMNIEAKQLGYETLEYVSSSIHSSYFPGLHFRARNPRRVDAVSTHNFMLIEATNNEKSGQWKVQMNCLNSNLRSVMSHQKTIKRG